MARDPIADRGGSSHYEFARNAATGWIDVLGLFAGLPFPDDFDEGWNGNTPAPIPGPSVDEPFRNTDPEHRDGTKVFETVWDETECEIRIVIPIAFRMRLPFDRNWMDRLPGWDKDTRAAFMQNWRKAALEFDVNRFVADAQTAIDAKWNQFKICCECDNCPNGLKLTVKLEHRDNAHNRVKVFSLHHGNGLNGEALTHQSNQFEWNLDQGISDVSTHEIGHFLGNVDEAKGPTDNIMKVRNGPVEPKHFDSVKGALQMWGKKNCTVVPRSSPCP